MYLAGTYVTDENNKFRQEFLIMSKSNENYFMFRTGVSDIFVNLFCENFCHFFGLTKMADFRPFVNCQKSAGIFEIFGRLFSRKFCKNQQLSKLLTERSALLPTDKISFPGSFT